MMPEAERPAYIERTLDFVLAARFDALPADVLDRTRWIIADSLATIAAGMQEPALRALADRMAGADARGNAWVIGAQRRAAPQPAAFLNGTAGTWLELDEGNLFGNGHPGIQVVPAALAHAQSHAVSGREFLRAVALGYEICARVGGAAKMKLWVHPHGTHGVIGAALACALMRNASRDELRHVINIAAAMGLGTNRQAMREGATVRNVFTGHSGIAGQLVPDLAAAGILGQAGGIDVTYTHVLADGFDRDRYLDGLGERWVLLDNYFKLYPAGRYIHSPIDALLDLLERERFAAEAVESIDVRTFRMAAFLEGKQIDSAFGAKFSVPFALATAIVHGHAGLDAFGDRAVRDARVQALMQRVRMREEPAFSAEYPGKQISELAVRLRDGRTLTGRCDVMRGEPSRPHPPQALAEKFRSLGEPIWGEALTERLLGDALAIERIADLGAHAASLDI